MRISRQILNNFPAKCSSIFLQYPDLKIPDDKLVAHMQVALCYTSHVTPHASRVTRHTSLVTALYLMSCALCACSACAIEFQMPFNFKIVFPCLCFMAGKYVFDFLLQVNNSKRVRNNCEMVRANIVALLFCILHV